MSEIRVTSVVGENGGDRVGLTTGLTVGPLTGTTGIGATITHQGHAQFAGVCTATSFVDNGAGLTNVSAGKILQVVQTHYSDLLSNSTASGAVWAPSQLNCTITPTSSSSKVLITAKIGIGFSVNTRRVFLKAFRDSTEIATAIRGIRLDNSMSINFLQNQSSLSIAILDTHGANGSTAITYKLRGKTSSGKMYTNSNFGTQSNFSVYEVAPN